MLTVAAFCALSIVLIWFGYPLAVGALAGLFWSKASSRESSRRSIRVIIATLDPPETIRARIVDILAADYPSDLLSVVVALDHAGSVRASEVEAALGRLNSRVRVVEGAAPGGKASTLNAAVHASDAGDAGSGDILVFADAAQRFDSATIGRLASALDDERFGAVSGALQIGKVGAPHNLAEHYWLFEKWLRKQEARLHSAVGVTGAVYAMRRSCWHSLPAGLILDDLYAPMNLVLRGYRVGFDPNAIAFDERRFAPGQEFKRKARTLTGVVQLCLWLPEVLIPWRNPIWLQFVFHKLLRLLTPYLLFVMVIALVVEIVRVLGSLAPMLALGALAGVGVVAVVSMAASRRLRDGVVMLLAMQGAMIRATLNGMRGRWDVWSR